ncbi:lactoylglutathione lyase [Gemmobacter aquatilis]|uniref:Lactoylglutathione lyase n=1 Tax=Gemmobacter aquatilis TaxID=933059 RepID=A0A1H8DJN2_9RHOB|nr:VOC family protein [Gemmobacter aquatilis]SEN07552.1 lactoylglutathione lyase [Gemmobacter aquatilis]
MFSHVTLGISDFGRALGFWRPVMAALGHAERFVDPAKPWAAWQPAAGGRPLFMIMQPFDGKAPAPGNGAMVAFAAPDRATVRAAHAAALAHGGTCDGPPGLRPQYHPDYYGAYLRDPDGNKLCLVCHLPEAVAG